LKPTNLETTSSLSRSSWAGCEWLILLEQSLGMPRLALGPIVVSPETLMISFSQPLDRRVGSPRPAPVILVLGLEGLWRSLGLGLGDPTPTAMEMTTGPKLFATTIGAQKVSRFSLTLENDDTPTTDY
jgi:hypothetical protein